MEILIDHSSIFWFCALTGSGMFVIHFFLNFFGVHQEDFDDGGMTDINHFKWLSKQTVIGFLMMFGWTGLTCQKEFHLQNSFAIIVAFVVGLLTLFLIGFIFKAAKKLHSTGNVFKIEDSIGKEAFVYQQIPKNGAGKITLSLEHCTCEIHAVSHDQEEIPSFTRVHIIKKIDDNTVAVATIQ